MRKANFGFVSYDHSIGKFGAVAYDRELSQEEIDAYELQPLVVVAEDKDSVEMTEKIKNSKPMIGNPNNLVVLGRLAEEGDE